MLTLNCLHMYVPIHISHNHQQTGIFAIYISLMLHFLTFPFFFFFRRLTGQVKIQDFSVIKKMDPSVSASHFSTLKEQSTAFFTVWSQHQLNKSDQLTVFNHRCLIFGSPKGWLRFEWLDFLSVTLDEVLMCALSHSRGGWTVKPAACDGSCVCSNDEWLFSLLVLWGLSGSLQPWQAGFTKEGRQTKVMYSYQWSHSLPVILPIWGHEGAIKNH